MYNVNKGDNMTENTREITIDDARKLYNSSEEAKTFLLSRFTKEELEGKNIPSQEEFDTFFEENILSLIDNSKTKFSDSNGIVSKKPTSSILLFNSNGEWLFDYNYDQKNQGFWYSYDRVYTIFMNTFSLSYVDRDRLMKSLVKKHFNLRDTQPLYGIENHRI
jgi:hypothetical protein